MRFSKDFPLNIPFSSEFSDAILVLGTIDSTRKFTILSIFCRDRLLTGDAQSFTLLAIFSKSLRFQGRLVEWSRATATDSAVPRFY
jgi:hypothetical protein